MTNDAPGAPADPTGSCQSLAAALRTTADVRATSAGPVATGPKLPPYTGD